MGEDEAGDGPDVVGGGRRPAAPPGVGGGRPGQHDVGPQALGPGADAGRARRLQQVVVEGGRDGVVQPRHQLELPLRPEGCERVRVGVERHPAAHHLGPGGRVDGAADVDGEPEAVEQLGPEVALLGVHRPDEEEPGGVGVRHAVALDPVDAGGSGVEEGVDEVVGQQVDLVDVEDAAVGGGQQPGLEPDLAAGQRRPEVEGADHPLLGGAEGQLHERPAAGEESGQPPGQRRLGRPLVAPQQDAADRAVDGGHGQGQLGVVAPDDGGDRERWCGRTGDGQRFLARLCVTSSLGVGSRSLTSGAPRCPRPPAGRRAGCRGRRGWPARGPARWPRAGARRCYAAPTGSTARRTPASRGRRRRPG